MCGYDSELGDVGRRPSGRLAAWAGLFGAIPFGLGVSILVLTFLSAAGPNRPPFAESLLSVISVTVWVGLPLVPFAVAMTRVDGRGWLRVLGAVVPGLVMGAGSLFLGFLVGLVLLPAGLLGLGFGLITVGPCWSRGDAAGRALALLGVAPTLLLGTAWVAEQCSRALPPDAATRFAPWVVPLELTGGVVVCLAALALVVFRARRRTLTGVKPTPRGWDE